MRLLDCEGDQTSRRAYLSESQCANVSSSTCENREKSSIGSNFVLDMMSLVVNSLRAQQTGALPPDGSVGLPLALPFLSRFAEAKARKSKQKQILQRKQNGTNKEQAKQK